MNFSVFPKNWVSGILGPPYCGIGATILIGREMLCLPYAGLFLGLSQQTQDELLELIPLPPSHLDSVLKKVPFIFNITI